MDCLGTVATEKCRMITKSKQEFCTAKKAGPTLVWLWHHQRDLRHLWTTGSEYRTLFITVDNTRGKMMVCSVDNNCGMTLKSNNEATLIFAHILCLKWGSPQGASVGGSDCGNRISDANFLRVFHSNYGTILLSFWDVAMGQTMHWRTTDWRWTDGRRNDVCNFHVPDP